MTDFWETLDQLHFDSEASVEHLLVLPLLAALGYELSDISPKHPVIFREGRVGRKPEADFVLFYGHSRSKDVSLITIEAKKPEEKLEDAKLQCESYAFNLRTPFTLLTNGLDIEIWQIQVALESSLLLRESVKDMARSRGKIESLISKNSAYEYAKSLAYKNFSEANQDFSIYEKSTLTRYIKSIYAIERRLFSLTIDQKKYFPSSSLLKDFPYGAIILGASGYGKTTIHNSLIIQALEARQNNSNLKLPIDIYLPDLVINKLSIFEFIFQRIQAHQPGLTEYKLKDFLRHEGAILFFDAFDRLKEDDKKYISSDVVNLKRDYPLIQFFIFSRVAEIPRLELKTLYLEILCGDEKIYFIESILNKNEKINKYISPPILIYGLPDILREFASYPLLLELIVRYWLLNGFISNNIISLFQSWLESTLLSNEKNVLEYTYLEQALSLIACETVKSPLSKSEVVYLFKKNNISLESFHELSGLDAICFRGDSVEVKHEALADYLRVKTIVNSKGECFIESLVFNDQMHAESLFPVLLMAMLPTFNIQDKLWYRLSCLDFNLYINSLRYRADHSKEIAGSGKVSDIFLKEIIDGFELPLKGFLPQLEKIITNDITHNNEAKLAISGNLSEDLSWVTYSIHSREEYDPRINIGNIPLNYAKQGVNLKLSKYRLDSGRLIGSLYLLKKLFRIIEDRKIIGAKTYRMDRLVSRLRYLNQDYPIKTTPFDSFENIMVQLSAYEGYHVPITYNKNNSHFAIADLVSDIYYLKNEGLDSLDSWWLRLGYKYDLKIYDEKKITDILCETFSRIQLIYKELVENSFFSMRELFGFYMALPVRWEVYITQEEYGLSMDYSWFPVPCWTDSCTNVYFKEPLDKSFLESSDEIEKALKKLGRDKAECYSMGASCRFFHFDGADLFSGRVNGETAALKEACDLIKEDVKRIFGDLERMK